ncbi:hypothetical protein BHE74_00005985 [Ensete ventricosum]|uniref:Isopenicillin N synthase-like Fe(2+) 2OG dioxygenase domain-containing protein n=1 Tax=Ensete ventricosum TaxID=4639 RepID=A0A426Z2I3_ENSVE|nr:hypothetical protein B296_00004890 [Ensete ventricosum]RWW85353.1 hypothetical protein BHE74_00005985 [Ensete ventricosum]
MEFVAGERERGDGISLFSDVGMACAGTPAWYAVREQVMPALGFHGCFEAVYNRVASELRRSLLGIAKDLGRYPSPRHPSFTSLLWPSGSNPNFCGGVGGDGEGGGVGEPGRCGVAEQMQSTCSLLRFTEYGAAGEWEEEKRKLAHMAHQDKNMLSIVCQLNEVDGLQVEAMDGEWLLAAPRSVASSSSRERLSTYGQ